jgi:hypothetical protein
MKPIVLWVNILVIYTSNKNISNKNFYPVMVMCKAISIHYQAGFLPNLLIKLRNIHLTKNREGTPDMIPKLCTKVVCFKIFKVDSMMFYIC